MDTTITALARGPRTPGPVPITMRAVLGWDSARHAITDVGRCGRNPKIGAPVMSS